MKPLLWEAVAQHPVAPTPPSHYQPERCSTSRASKGSVQAIVSNGRLQLCLSVVPKPSTVFSDPGSSFGTAYDLRGVSGNRVVQDFVGTLDKADYYKFTLDKGANFSAMLSDLSGLVMA